MESIKISIPSDILKDLRDMAASDLRTLSNMAGAVLIKHVEARRALATRHADVPEAAR